MCSLKFRQDASEGEERVKDSSAGKQPQRDGTAKAASSSVVRWVVQWAKHHVG